MGKRHYERDPTYALKHKFDLNFTCVNNAKKKEKRIEVQNTVPDCVTTTGVIVVNNSKLK